MKKLIGIVFILLVLYNSVYIKKLSSLQNANADKSLLTNKRDEIYQKGIIQNTKQIEWNNFLQQVNEKTDSVFLSNGNLMGIGSSRSFLVYGKATIKSIEDGQISLSNGSVLDTKYIFGNELRDASKYVQLNEFHSQKDLNQLTESLNQLVREKIIPEQVAKLKQGDSISFIGAVQVSKKELPISHCTIYPAQIK